MSLQRPSGPVKPWPWSPLTSLPTTSTWYPSLDHGIPVTLVSLLFLKCSRALPAQGLGPAIASDWNALVLSICTSVIFLRRPTLSIPFEAEPSLPPSAPPILFTLPIAADTMEILSVTSSAQLWL